MKVPYYFLFDCETGGIDPITDSLLTLYGLILTEDLEEVTSIDLAIKPDDGIYKLRAEAMKINKIDIVKHDAVACKETVAANKLQSFLAVMRQYDSGGNAIQLIPAGHNPSLDINFTRQLLNKYSDGCYDLYLNRRVFDTGATARFLQATGRIPKGVNCSLIGLTKYYGVTVDNTKLHNAQTDVEATLGVMRKMIETNKV